MARHQLTLSPTPELVVVGAAARDLTAADPRGWRIGGSATYAALTACKLGLRVACVIGLDPEAAQAHELTRLREGGVQLLEIPLARGPVFRNRESNGVRHQEWTCTSDRIPASLPEPWRRAPNWLFVPVADELDPSWADAPEAGAYVGVGWQGLLREFRQGGRVRPAAPGGSKILDRANVVVASVDDFGPTTSLPDALACIDPGAMLILTGGARGGLLFAPTGWRRYPAISSTRSDDPTGAGDVFLATFVSSRALMGGAWTVDRALRFSAAAGSCAVERTGLGGVPTARRIAMRLYPSRPPG